MHQNNNQLHHDRVCAKCCFFEVCSERGEERCDDYAPAQLDEEETGLIIERGRMRFTSEWLRYLEESLYYID